MGKATFVYRLIVTYPEGSHTFGWHPDCAEGEEWVDEYGYFRWPAVKSHLTASAANRRAQLFRKYGATATVERSLPVTWPAS